MQWNIECPLIGQKYAAGRMPERLVTRSAGPARVILWIISCEGKEGVFSLLLPCIRLHLHLVHLFVRGQC